MMGKGKGGTGKNSIVIILQSCLKEESKKPVARLARTARRTVLDAARSTEVFVADLAKAFLAYEAPKASMEVVKAFTSRCMEDENASAMFDASLLEFEGHFDDVFEDLNAWMFSGPNGTALPLDKICIALTRVDGVLVATLNALNRWSISGLQEQANVVIETLVNALTLSKVGTWVYLREFCTEVVDPLSAVKLANPEQVQTQATPGSEVALASVPQNPGGQPSDVISTEVVSMAEIASKHIATFQTGTVRLVKGLRVALQNAHKAWEIIEARLGVHVATEPAPQHHRAQLARRESIALLHGSEAAEVMKYEDVLVPVRGPNAWRALRDQEAHALPVPRIVIDVIVIPPPSLTVIVPLPAAFPFILPPYPPGRHRALEVHQLDPAVWADSPPGEGHSEGWNPFIPE